MAWIASDTDMSSSYESLGYYSVSYYDYVINDECAGFGWNLLNATNEKVNSFLNPLLVRIMTLYLQPLIAVFGVLGNLAFIFIVCKVPDMRNRINIILLNLSIADLVYLLLGTGEKFLKMVHSPVWGDSLLFGQIFQCFIIIPVLNAVSFTSLLLVSVISVERYMAVCRPLQHLKVTSQRVTSVSIFLVWFLSFALAVILLPSNMDYFTVCIKWPDIPLYANLPLKVGFCLARNDLWYSIGDSMQTFPFLFAVSLQVVCYTKIISRLYGRMTSSYAPRRQQHNRTVNKHRNSAKSATRMLLFNGMAFCLLATPFHVTNAFQFFESISTTWICDCQDFKDISLLLLYLNSAVNPYIYGVTNRTYRQAYYRVFCESQSKSRRRRSTTTLSIYDPSDTMQTNV